MPSMKTVVGLLALSVFASTVVCAATSVTVQPGLWVGATETTINGNRAPNILDIQGALGAEEKRKIASAMAKYGLPAGWQPDTVCVTSPTYDLNEFLAAIGKQGCSSSNVQATQGRVRFQGHCELPNGSLGPTIGDVTGELSLTGKTKWQLDTKLVGTIGGYPVTTVSQQMARWIGADCRAVPEGLSADVLGNAGGEPGGVPSGDAAEAQ